MADFQEIIDEIGCCQLCGLANGCLNSVPGEGAMKPAILFVGEGPGAEEDKTGRPFVGRAGKLLDKILESVDFSRDEVFITNIVKCRPPGNRDPQPDEIKACTPFLERQIKILQPKVIITLGRFSMNYFLGQNCGTITKMMGSWHKIETSLGTKLHVVPFFHPAYLLRNPTKKPGGPKSKTWKAIREVKERLASL